MHGVNPMLLEMTKPADARCYPTSRPYKGSRNPTEHLPAAAYFLYGVQIEFSQTEIEPIRGGKNKASSETPNLVLRSLNSKWKSVRIYFHILEVKILTWK